MRYFTLILLVAAMYSCNSNQIAKDFNCKTTTYSNLEKIDDYKKLFSFDIPKKWKTNLYYDDAVSSIYTADTTISLTKTTVIDASFIVNTSEIDDKFIQKVKNDNTTLALEEVKSSRTTFLNNQSYYNLAKGKKGKYQYHVLNIFSKAKTGFLHVKAEVYGDSLVEDRICKAVKLVNNIQLK